MKLLKKLLKKLFFLEASPLIDKGKTHILVESDMLSLPDHLHPKSNTFPEDKLDWSSHWKHLWSVITISRSELKHAYSWYIMSAAFSLASPLLVNRFVKLISAGIVQQNLMQALTTGVLLGLCGFLTGFCLQQYFYHALGAYQIVTNILNKILFSHSLKLSMQARGKNQLGDIVNYMSSDSDAIADFTFVFGDLTYNVLMIVGVIAMLFHFLGVSAVAALIAFFSLAPLTSFVAKRFTKLEEEMMSYRDKRVTLMTQALNAIRVVKYFAWEKSVEKEVMDIRDRELSSRKKLARSEVLSGLGYMAVSTIVLFIALATHALRGKPIDAALIFTCVSLFGLIEGPFGDLSHLISRCTNGYVGAIRLSKFLKQETKLETEVNENAEKNSDAGVELSHLTAFYENAENPVLKDINLKVNHGESVAIVGPVGSGKSSLLYSILGELKIKEGKVHFTDNNRPKISYLPQEAYIINSTMLENILFGEDCTDDEIQHALLFSCLSKDLLQFSGGLMTEIGEKGVNLSGGQKQRVGLARAYLSKPDLILLDDPLSAVDHDTEDKLCELLIFGAWKNKTRIVVTHRLEHLNQFDKVFFIQDGKITDSGKYEELVKNSPAFREFYAEHSKSRNESAAKGEEEVIVEQKEKSKTESLVRITEDEDRETGAVKKTIYFDYVKSLGGDDPKTRPWILLLLIAGAVFVALAPLIQKAWLSYFSTHQNKMPAIHAIGIYGIIGICVLVLSLLNNFFWLERGIKSGKNMHDKMLASVLGAPVRFFDSTPVGRIIQRFSRDIESVDVYLQWSFISVVHCLLQIAVSVCLILALVPFMIVIIAPVLFAYYIIQKNYRSPAREAKRFDSVARSPRYSHFKETLQGLVVIRSFSKEKWFMESFYQKLAESQRMFYSHYMLNRWFSSRIPMIGGIISMSTAIGITISAYYGWMNAGTAGLVTLYSLSFWGYLNWGVRMFADIESRMTSIERLKFFANLPAEPQVLKATETVLASVWPPEGQLVAENIKVRYAPHLPFVLKGISFKIPAGSKVGIVGRTGSGKSTLFQTLFRFIELEEGCISIDGVDISTVPLERLRKSIAVIPQDPTLFMGTIRNNLDRYNEYSDDEVIRVLKHSGLWSMIEILPGGLNAEVYESGSNFSQGQRQLLCLSRALLINAKIIVMDEATASVDVQTDALLQKVIREELKGITMLIIAHRLGTVKDCDQIIEIDGGKSRTIKKHEITPEVIA
jgi:ABC-type multidrug transport system fused ATPase/permease subunit